MMQGLSGRDLKGDAYKRWVDARRRLYRRVLRNPGASPEQKAAARQKIEEVSPTPK